MPTLLLLAMLISMAFNDHVSCTVQGYVYRGSDQEPVSFTRVDGCTGVQVEEDQNAIVMHSPTIYGVVLIPPDKGHRRFQYRWGADHAYVESQGLAVAWGYLERG